MSRAVSQNLMGCRNTTWINSSVFNGLNNIKIKVVSSVHALSGFRNKSKVYAILLTRNSQCKLLKAYFTKYVNVDENMTPLKKSHEHHLHKKLFSRPYRVLF